MATSTRNRQPGLALVAEFEGFRDTAYLCPAGVLTIGYGFTRGVKRGDKITRAEADARLLKEYVEFEAGVLRLVRVPLNDNQLAALVSFAFNLGLGNLKSSTLLRLLNEQDYQSAALQFAKWNWGAGRVMAGLTRRRAAEADLFRKPVPIAKSDPDNFCRIAGRP